MPLAGLCLILIVLWTLLAYVAIPLPLEDPLFAWVKRQWLAEGIVLLTGLGGLSLLSVSAARKRMVHLPPWWAAWCLWMAWAAVSLIGSIDRGVSARAWLVYASYGVLAYLSSALLASARDLKLWLQFLCGVAAVVGANGFVQYVSTFPETLDVLGRMQADAAIHLQGWGPAVVHDFLLRKRIFSVFGWPNLLAGFLLLTIPLTIGLTRAASSRGERIGWGLAAGGLSIGFLLTLSLGGWMAAVLTIGIAWWCRHRLTAWRQPRQWRILPVLGGALAVCVVLFVTSLIVSQRAKSAVLSSTHSRLVYVQGALNIIRAHPLLGTGPGTFGLAYRALMPREAVEGQHSAQHAHNTVLQFAAELGLIGAALFLLFLWRVGRLALQAIRGAPDPASAALAWGMSLGLLGFFLHSLIEQTFVEAVTAPFWWIVLGLLTATARPTTRVAAGPAAGHPSRPRRAALSASSAPGGWGPWPASPAAQRNGVWLAAIAVGIGMVSRLAAADAWMAIGAWRDLKGQPAEAQLAFNHAQRWDPWSARCALEQAERLMRTAAGKPPHEAVPLLRQARQQLARTIRLSPWLGYAWMRLGMVDWQLGAGRQALYAMEQAVRLDPNSRAAQAYLAQLYRAVGKSP